jgi:cytochrome c553
VTFSRSVRANATALTVAFVLLGTTAPLRAADAEAGRQKANVCAACHGEGGNSTNPAVPSLAQQPAQFVSTALFMFREGNRKDPQMSPMAANLSNEDMNDLAAFFSAQKAAPPAHKSNPENAKAGPELAQKFNCTQCHGRGLLGQQHIPRIAGQQFEYLRVQLKGFKAGTRADIDGNMTSAARALSEKDIEVLSDFIAGASAQ